MKNLLLYSILLICSGFAVNHCYAKDVIIEPNITKVTVYSLGAEVTHNIKIVLPSGQNSVKLMGVSPFAVANTIQIADEDITVINSTLVKKLSNSEVLSLADEKEACLKQIEALNLSLSNTSYPRTAENLEGLINFYNRKVIQLKRNIRQIEAKLQQDSVNEGVPYLNILVSTSKNVSKSIEIKYIVGSAAWVPEYEIFVPEINKDLKLKYIAKIMNSTGEDWNNVELNLSLNSPFDKTGEIPKIKPVYLGRNDYSQNYDYNEEYQEDDNLKKLDQLKIEGIEYVEYDAPAYTDLLPIEGNKTIPANGGIYAYDVFLKELKTNYVWYAFPGYEENPYLIGQVAGWNTLPLVDGDASIFLKGTNIGDSYISIAGFPDTLDIPIGQNKEVSIERKIIGNETFTKETNNKTKETLAFSYVVRNNRSEDVSIKIFDQIPVTQSNRIDVELIDHSGSEYKEETGEITWYEANLKSKDEKSYKLIYNIEYDKSRNSSLFGSNKNNFYRSSYSMRKVRAKF